MATLFLVNGVVLGSWLPRLPELRDRLGLGLGEVGLTLAVGGIGGLAGSAVSGLVVGWFGTRRSALYPALALMALLPLLAIAPSAIAFAIVIGVVAVVDSIADVGMNAFAVRVEEARGGSIFSRLHGVWSLGALLGATISTAAVASRIGLDAQLVATAVVGLAAVIWAGRLLPEPGRRTPPSGSTPVGRIALWLAVAGAGAAFLEGTPSDWSALFLTDALGASPAVAGAGFLGLSVGMVVGRLGGDAVVERMGMKATLTAGLVVVAGAVSLTVLSPGVALALAALVAWGLGISIVLPLLYRQAGSHPAMREGSGLAALTLGSRVGFLAGPAAVGAVAELASLPVGIVVVMAAALIGSAGAIVVTLDR